ncbi:MAG: DUF1203 domain-containing protein [Luteimonas sp.]
MDYVVSGLALQSFQPLFGLDDAALRAHAAARMRVDVKPGFPCRVTLEDAEPGETAAVAVAAPRRRHAVSRRRADLRARDRAGKRARPQRDPGAAAQPAAVGARLRCRRLDARCEVVDGVDLDALIERFLADPRIDFLHVHNARRGCYACRIDRG